MSGRLCVVLGTGRVAGGFLAPLLRAAGCEVVLVGRDGTVVEAVNEAGGVWEVVRGRRPEAQFIGGVRALRVDRSEFPALVARADLVVTAVGASALRAVGRTLAPALDFRLRERAAPLNLLTFENHRRSPELLLRGLVETHAQLARSVGVDLGFGGAVVWRTVSRRIVGDDGVRFVGDDATECYVDSAGLVGDAPPLDGSLPGVTLVRSFDDRMIEKLWLFNAGHAAAAYLGWHGGVATIDEAMRNADIRRAVTAVVAEAQVALAAHVASRPASAPLPQRPAETILERYADPRLGDSIVRVAREPRRKLAAGDRLLGPALASLGAGIRPDALALACAAALSYAEATDLQAADLQRELELVGPEEALATVSALDPRDDFARLASHSYRGLLAA